MKSKDRIVWLDLEYYSFDDPRVLECAVIITDKSTLKEVARRNWVIQTSQHTIERRVLGGSAGNFHREHSQRNGLLKECRNSKLTHDKWQRELLKFLKQHCAPGCRLAGFSPHTDRDVLSTQAPLVQKYFSHQIVDVSTLDVLQWGLPVLETAARQERQNGSFQATHRAMEDNEAAIRKLKWYQNWLKENIMNQKVDINNTHQDPTKHLQMQDWLRFLVPLAIVLFIIRYHQITAQ